MRVSLKLLPLAAVVALGVAVLMPGGGFAPHSAQADVDDLNFDPTEFVSGGSTQGHATFDAEATGTVLIEVTDFGDADDVELSLGDCDPGVCNDDDGSSNMIEIDDSVDDVEFTLTATCDVQTSIEVTVSEDDGGTDIASVNCLPGANVTIHKVATDDTDLDFDFDIDGEGTECDGSFVLADGESAEYSCDGDVTISEDLPAGWTLDISCTGDVDEDVDEDNSAVSFTIADDEDIDCTFTNEFLGTVTPGTPGSVTVSVSSNSPACNLPVVVVATIRDEEGEIIGGAEVTFSAPSGSFTIAEGTTSASGVISTLYSPPNTGSDSIVLTATANGESGTATITTNCQPAEPTATSVPPTSTPGSTGPISPPSTGDGGLATGSSAPLAGAAALIASAFVGAMVVVRRRS